VLRSLAIATLAAALALPGLAAGKIPSREVDFEVVARDGVLLRGVVAIPDPEGAATAARRWPVAILVPAQFRPRGAFVPLSDALADAGVASVMLDLRGQGDSMTTGAGEIYSGRLLPPGYLRLAAGDQAQVLEALARLPELDLSRVALVGVAQGALVAAAAAADLPAARGVVMVDATESAGGLSAERDLGLLGTRPALLLCSGFPVSRERATALAEYGLGERTVRCVREFFNGDAVLAEDGAGTPAVTTWLVELLAPRPTPAPRGGAEAPAPERR